MSRCYINYITKEIAHGYTSERECLITDGQAGVKNDGSTRVVGAEMGDMPSSSFGDDSMESLTSRDALRDSAKGFDELVDLAVTADVVLSLLCRESVSASARGERSRLLCTHTWLQGCGQD
ncbi:unnamed protein product [Sympodiomycopsis kandeliae]